MATTVEMQDAPGDVAAIQQVVHGALQFVQPALTLQQALGQGFRAISLAVVVVEQQQGRRDAVHLDLRRQAGGKGQRQIVLRRLAGGIGAVLAAAMAANVVADMDDVGLLR